MTCKERLIAVIIAVVALSIIALVLPGCIKSPLSVCGTPGSCTFNTQATTTVQAPKIDGL